MKTGLILIILISATLMGLPRSAFAQELSKQDYFQKRRKQKQQD